MKKLLLMFGIIIYSSVIFGQCINPLPPNDITPAPNTFICSGNSTTLSATGTGTVTWFSTPSSTLVLGTGNNFITPTLTAGTFTYYAEADTCLNSLTRTAITLTVNPLPTVVATPPAPVCSGATACFSVTGATTYTWAGPCGFFSVAQSPCISVPSVCACTYSVWGKDVNGCVNSATACITFLPPPFILPFGASAICSGQSTILNVTGSAFSFTWSTGANTQTISISPTVTTTYTISGAGVNTCTNSATKTITVNALPTVSATTSSSLLCAGQSATLSAAGALTYTWSTGSNFNNIVVSPTVTTTYTLTGADAVGCTSLTIITQSVSPCTGIHELPTPNTELILFPNPNNGLFTLSINKLSENINIEIYNSVGQLIHNQKIVSENTNLNIIEWANGIYFLRVLENNVILKQEKIVKE